eukprot:2619987-Amphidinium_carterae.1
MEYNSKVVFILVGQILHPETPQSASNVMVVPVVVVCVLWFSDRWDNWNRSIGARSTQSGIALEEFSPFVL